jgi:hypothetical protein
MGLFDWLLGEEEPPHCAVGAGKANGICLTCGAVNGSLPAKKGWFS